MRAPPLDVCGSGMLPLLHEQYYGGPGGAE